MTTKHRVIFGDARQMTLVGDNSTHLVVTSPPYWQLKDYEAEGQIGFDDTYEDYINNLNLVWLECLRVLNNGCKLCINIGDQFARSVYYGRYKVIPIRTEIIRFCETIGFDFMGSIIWQKVTTCNTTGGATIMGSYPFPRNGIVKMDYEFILLFKKHGKSPGVDREIKEASKLTNEDWNLFFKGHWIFPGEKQSGHIAMFPEELPRRLIKMFTFKGETVLDPFMGSGTTALASMKLERESIGYEINGDFEESIRAKTACDSNLCVSANTTFEHDRCKLPDTMLDTLPYRFKDPLKFDRKTDPRKLQFGSVVSKADSRSKTVYHKVKDILSADRVKLDNDLVVRLIGITPIEERATEALRFLATKVKGKQVYLKYDESKYDEADTLLVYLYLKNRTFINAHLLKRGYAAIDRSYPFNNKTLAKYRG